jgi:mono/diheme cytochrome c family protein
MRRGLAVAVAVAAVALVAAGCGGEENAAPLPETVEGTVAQPPPPPPGGEGDPEAGKQIFTGKGGCGTCHTLSDAGTSGTVGPNLDEAKPSFDEAVTTITNGRNVMPSFKGQLSEEEIRNVAAYVSSAAGA